MNELDAIKQRRMEELVAMKQQEMQEEEQLNQQITQLEAVIKTLLTKEALERYGNIKASNPEKAVQLLAVIGQLIQSGKARTINDEELKKILILIEPKKREIKITMK